jgi:proliferating cell nuclear antigen
MLKLTLAEPRYLKDSISLISELVNEASFKITPNYIELVAMDPANVAMVIFKLLSSAFTEYDVSKEVDLAINLNNLKQILRRAKANDSLTLELSKDNKLKILLKGTSSRTFSLPLIDLEEKEQKIPQLKFPLTIEASTSLIEEAIEDVDIVAESVSLIAEPKKLTIAAEGDLSDASILMQHGDDVKIKMSGSGKIRSKYSIEYLKNMIRAAKLADKATMEFDNNYPLRITFREVDKFMLNFILAPRVEE